MNRPTLLGGVLFAFVASLLAAPLFWALSSVLGTWTSFRAVTAFAQLGYLLYLVRIRRSRIGTVTLAALNLGISALLCALPTPPVTMAVTLTLLLSLSRILLFQRTFSAAAMDGLVATGGLLFAGYTLRSTESLPMAVWAFLLVQTLFVLIPPGLGRGPGGMDGETETDPFSRSQRQAEAALERLIRS